MYSYIIMRKVSIGFVACSLFLGLAHSTYALSSKFSEGDRVKVANTSGWNLSVRADAGIDKQILGKRAPESLGTIKNTATNPPRLASGVWWWDVAFDGNVRGWANERFLEKIGTTTPLPPPPPPQQQATECHGIELSQPWGEGVESGAQLFAVRDQVINPGQPVTYCARATQPANRIEFMAEKYGRSCDDLEMVVRKLDGSGWVGSAPVENYASPRVTHVLPGPSGVGVGTFAPITPAVYEITMTDRGTSPSCRLDKVYWQPAYLSSSFLQPLTECRGIEIDRITDTSSGWSHVRNQDINPGQPVTFCARVTRPANAIRFSSYEVSDAGCSRAEMIVRRVGASGWMSASGFGATGPGVNFGSVPLPGGTATIYAPATYEMTMIDRGGTPGCRRHDVSWKTFGGGSSSSTTTLPVVSTRPTTPSQPCNHYRWCDGDAVCKTNLSCWKGIAVDSSGDPIKECIFSPNVSLPVGWTKPPVNFCSTQIGTSPTDSSQVKVGVQGVVFENSDKHPRVAGTVRLSGAGWDAVRTTAESNNYAFSWGNLQREARTVSLALPSGFRFAEWSVCYNAVGGACHNTAGWRKGTEANIALNYQGFADVWFRLTR